MAKKFDYSQITEFEQQLQLKGYATSTINTLRSRFNLLYETLGPDVNKWKWSIFAKKKRNSGYEHSTLAGIDSCLNLAQYFLNSDESKLAMLIEEPSLTITEKLNLIYSRVGQGIFRHRVMEMWENKCAISGIDLRQVLVASHIKPWRSSTNSERLSGENGLLLSANMDKLFDSGAITFENNGKIRIGSDKKVKKLIIETGCFDHLSKALNSAQRKFMEYHRDKVFVQ